MYPRVNVFAGEHLSVFVFAGEQLPGGSPYYRRRPLLARVYGPSLFDQGTLLDGTIRCPSRGALLSRKF